MSVIGSNILAGSSGQGGAGYEIERSLRFDSTASSYLNRTPSSAGNQKTFTLSFWAKLCDISSTTNYIYTAGSGSPGGLNSLEIGFDLYNRFVISEYGASASNYYVEKTSAYHRDPSAWYHFIVAVDTTQATATNRVKFYVNGVEQTKESTNYAFPQNRDTAVNSTTVQTIGSDGASDLDGYLAEVNFIDGQALAASDFGEYDDNNVWQPKEYAGTYGTNGFKLDFSDTSSNAALGTDSSGNGNTWTVNNLTALIRDVSAAGTTSGSPYSATFPWSTAFDGSITSIGAVGNTAAANGYVHTFTTAIPCTTAAFVLYSDYASALEAGNGCAMNGVALTAAASANWTKTTNTLPVGAGSVGAYFVYTVNLGGTPLSSVGVGNTMRIAAVLIDGAPIPSSGAGNDALRDTPVNGDPTNDTGAGGEITGNYATLNPLDKGAALVLADGNLKVVSVANDFVRSTIAVSSGKWYAEYTHGTGLGMVGVADKSGDTSQYLGQTSGGYGYYSAGTKYSGGASSYANSYTTGDVIGIAFDADNGTLTFYKNNTSQGTAFTGLTSGPYFFAAGIDTMANSVMNFGQRAFAYTAPSGYKALCTANLPDPTIADGSTAFDTSLYGGGSSSYTISGLSFSPDLVWSKRRDAAGRNALCDTVRGVTKNISSDRASAEITVLDGLTQFNSNGYVVGDDAGEYGWNGGSTSSFVNWAWDAGSSNTTIAAGGLNSSVYDQSQNWSGSGSPATGWAKAFDGQIGSYSYGVYSTGSSSLTFTFDVNNKPTWSNKIEVFFRKYDGTANVNGGSDFTTVSPWTTPGTYVEGWYDISSIAGTSGTLSSIYTSDVGSNYVSIQAIRLDGKILVDSTVSLVVPSIASTVRANPSAGFSIVKYTGDATIGRTIAHGLNAVPEFIIGKNTDSSINWSVYTKTVGAGNSLALNSANTPSGGTGIWGNVTPTSQVFTVGGDGNMNGNGNDMIAYCFAPVEGYSAFGSYTGNGSADGPFVYTGFAPAFVLIKNTSVSGTFWTIFDNKRGSGQLYPNEAIAESYYPGNTTDPRVSSTSNGFKVNVTQNTFNGSGNVMIYAAFASNPFKTSRAR